MAEQLKKAHLYFDDLNRIRILDPTIIKETEDLRDTSKGFSSKVQDFVRYVNSLEELLKKLGNNVEKQKMAAIGTRNLLNSITKERHQEQIKLQTEINEKSNILEQMDSEYDALQIMEAKQMETIELLTQLR